MKRRNILKLGLAGGLAGLIPRAAISACDPTSNDIEGPFYTPNAPQRNILYPAGAEGDLLFLTGTVYYRDCETPVPNAVLDVWQADHDGAYDNVGFDYRGQFSTDELGNYSMETILPGKYLNGAQFRPRHIHFKFRHQESELTTQLYFEGDTDIPGDPWASDPDAEGRIIPLSTDQQDNLHGVFDVTLDLEPSSSTSPEMHTGEARILSISPNPLVQSGNVRITLDRAGRVSLVLLNLDGRKVNVKHAVPATPGVHTLIMDARHKNGIKLPAGVYVLQLILDGNLCDAKRCIVL